ncbi:MAG: hypothetical protein JWN15_2052 [Firmicutes bacterium]|nr:hypothetical protein [Bacillota bacterium]
MWWRSPGPATEASVTAVTSWRLTGKPEAGEGVGGASVKRPAHSDFSVWGVLCAAVRSALLPLRFIFVVQATYVATTTVRWIILVKGWRRLAAVISSLN